MTNDNKNPEQAPDANRAPGQETPSRSYGRQVHEDNATTAEAMHTEANGQKTGDDAQRSGSPSETTN